MEMPHAAFMVRHALSGFYGSAGTFIVHKSGAVGLWTDSRYELAAQKICTAKGWSLIISSECAWEMQAQWIAEHSEAPRSTQKALIVLCELQFSQSEYKELTLCTQQYGYRLQNISHASLCKRALQVLKQRNDERGIALLSNNTIVKDTKDLWHLCEKHVPYNALEKLHALKNFVKNKGAHCFVSANIHEIAYLTGLRATLLPYLMLCPCVFALIHALQDTHYVFMLPEKLCTTSFAESLHKHLAVPLKSIHTIAYEALMKETIDVSNFTSMLQRHQNPHVLYDPKNIPSALVHALEGDSTMRACKGTLEEVTSPLRSIKDVRSDAEIALIRESIAVDCAALLEALSEVVEKLEQDETLYEKSIAEIVQKHRKAQAGFLEESFQSISAAGVNGALPHYAIADGAGSLIKTDEPYLLDCGAHYACATHAGTTDITRSFLFSELLSSTKHNARVNNSEKAHAYKEDYTAVLKAHIALATSVFPSSTTGKTLHEQVLAVLAKENNRSFGHGTGHGIGFCTDVHEGEEAISTRATRKGGLKPNMVFSNEPGYYAKNIWGIRLENMMRVCKSDKPELLQFETLTFFPFQQNLIIESKLTALEKTWLCNYQNTCMHMLKARASKRARRLLENLTS